jgi:hypothetical protein
MARAADESSVTVPDARQRVEGEMSGGASLILGVLAIGPSVQVDKAEPVRVYVFTATQTAGGQRSDDEKGRLDSVRELREALERKKGLTIVSDRSDATVVVEVLGREEREGAMGGFGGKTVTRMGDTIIRVRITSGPEESDLKGIGQGTWGRAAKDAADRIVKWIGRQSRGSIKPPSTLITEPVA